MTMNTLVNIPQEIYSAVAEHILESADDEHDGTMTFSFQDKEFLDKAGQPYFISAAGQLYYTPTIEEWGRDLWVDGVSFCYACCDMYDDDGEEVPTDFHEDTLRKYIC